MRRLETDYLVVGAGAMGMAFTDALIDHADVHVTIVGHFLPGHDFRGDGDSHLATSRVSGDQVEVQFADGSGPDDPDDGDESDRPECNKDRPGKRPHTATMTAVPDAAGPLTTRRRTTRGRGHAAEFRPRPGGDGRRGIRGPGRRAGPGGRQ